MKEYYISWTEASDDFKSMKDVREKLTETEYMMLIICSRQQLENFIHNRCGVDIQRIIGEPGLYDL